MLRAPGDDGKSSRGAPGAPGVGARATFGAFLLSAGETSPFLSSFLFSRPHARTLAFSPALIGFHRPPALPYPPAPVQTETAPWHAAPPPTWWAGGLRACLGVHRAGKPAPQIQRVMASPYGANPERAGVAFRCHEPGGTPFAAPRLTSLPRLPWHSPRSRGGCHSPQDEQRADPASGHVLRAPHGRGERMLLAGGCRSIPPPLRGVLAQPLAGLLRPRSSTSRRSKMPGSPPGAMPRTVPTSLSLTRSTFRGHGRAGAAFALGRARRKQGFPSLQVFPAFRFSSCSPRFPQPRHRLL